MANLLPNHLQWKTQPTTASSARGIPSGSATSAGTRKRRRCLVQRRLPTRMAMETATAHGRTPPRRCGRLLQTCRTGARPPPQHPPGHKAHRGVASPRNPDVRQKVAICRCTTPRMEKPLSQRRPARQMPTTMVVTAQQQRLQRTDGHKICGALALATLTFVMATGTSLPVVLGACPAPWPQTFHTARESAAVPTAAQHPRSSLQEAWGPQFQHDQVQLAA